MERTERALHYKWLVEAEAALLAISLQTETALLYTRLLERTR